MKNPGNIRLNSAFNFTSLQGEDVELFANAQQMLEWAAHMQSNIWGTGSWLAFAPGKGGGGGGAAHPEGARSRVHITCGMSGKGVEGVANQLHVTGFCYTFSITLLISLHPPPPPPPCSS